MALLLVCILIESRELISSTGEECFEITCGYRSPIAKIVKRAFIADKVLHRPLIASRNTIDNSTISNHPICRHMENIKLSVPKRKQNSCDDFDSEQCLMLCSGNSSTRPFSNVAQSSFCDIAWKFGSARPSFENEFPNRILCLLIFLHHDPLSAHPDLRAFEFKTS